MTRECKYCGKEIKLDMPHFRKEFCSQSCCYIYYMREGERVGGWTCGEEEEKEGEK